jgi:hypothetical protein
MVLGVNVMILKIFPRKQLTSIVPLFTAINAGKSMITQVLCKEKRHFFAENLRK